MTGVAEAPALDLSALVERLRLSGFRIDTRQYLTAHELLLALAAAGVQLDDDPDRLVSHLGPIFCTSVHEQDLFAEEVRQWFGREAPPSPPPTPPPPSVKRLAWIRAHWGVGVLAVATVAAVVFGGRWYLENVAMARVQGDVVLQLPDGRIEPAQVEVFWNDNPVPVDAGGRFTISATRNQLRNELSRLRVDAPGLPSPRVETRLESLRLRVVISTSSRPVPIPEPLPAPRVAVTLPGTRTETRVTPWTAVGLGALLVAGFVWGIAWLIDRARRIAAIRRLPAQNDPELVTLRVPDIDVLPIDEAHLRRAAIALRRRRDESLVDLDVTSTIEATVRAAGFFVPRYSSRRATPEYLTLVSRRGEDDHQARTFDAVLDHLADLGVVLDRYSFHDDPRFVHSETSARGYRLAEVVSKHHRATLLVCAESAAAFNDLARHGANWIEATRSLVRRIYLTPEAPYRWTRFEFDLIEAGFIVLPANESGWKALADLTMGGRLESFATAPYARAFPSVLGTNELRWLDRNEPPPDIVQKLMRQLKGFLGPEGFSWLCACAVYPEVTWPLTLRVAHGRGDYSTLPSLARLPWFRHGFMPDWLRRVLVDLLPREDERRLRSTLEGLLEELSQHASDRLQPSRSRLRIAAWIAPRDLLVAAAPGSPLRDQVFVGFMFGARRDPLWLRAPQLLARAFRRRVGRFVTPSSDPSPAVRSFRERLVARFKWWFVFRPASLRLALSAVLGLIAFGMLPPVMTQARVTTEQETISFAEIPSGEFAMGSDRNVDRQAATDEQPQHLLYVPTFLIATTVVTVAQYSVCVNEGACTPGDRRALTGPANWPVRYLSWSEALEYCRWLENGLKKWTGTPNLIAGVLSGRIEGRPWHVTLPSEAEWEKAARGADGRIYPWGNRIEPILAARRQAVQAGTPVPAGSDQSAASPYGVLDMGGNVGEWTRSLARPYPYTTADGRETLDDLQGGQGSRVIRGGSLEASNDGEVRAARRSTGPTNQRDALVGFRIAISSLDPVSTLPSDRSFARNTPPREVVPPTTPPQTMAVGAPTQTTAPKKAETPPKAIPSTANPTSKPSNAAAAASAEQQRRDYASVLAFIQQLESAYARLDVNEVARLWPSQANEFRRLATEMNRTSLDIVQSKVTVDGDTAIVRGAFRYSFEPRTSRRPSAQTQTIELTLRRMPAGSWVAVRP